MAQVGADARAYTDTGLARSTTYRYRVRAFHSGGNSPYAAAASAATAAR